MLFDVFPLFRFHNVSKFNVWKFKIWKFNTNFNHNNFFQNFVCTYNSNLQTQWPMMNFTFLNLKFPNLPSPLEQRIPPRRCGSLGDWMKCWNPGEMRPELGKPWSIWVHVWIFNFSGFCMSLTVFWKLFFESPTLKTVFDLWHFYLKNQYPNSIRSLSEGREQL